MNDSITYLNIPKRQAPLNTTASPSLFIGRKYQLPADLLPSNLHDVCANFSCSPDSGGAVALSDQISCDHIFLWDTDDLPSFTGATLVTPAGDSITVNTNTPVASNRFVLTNTRLNKPSIQTYNNDRQLAIQAEFDFGYTADQVDARLGVLSLVESRRFLLLENGQQHNLLNTDEQSVLFLTSNDQNNAISPIIDASKSNSTLNLNWQVNVTQSIPDQVNGIAMETLTILEQYQTFFMHRELPFSSENIWTPICAPISWGWSMRIARRYDGEWGIARQKLLMPSVGHNGMEMPTWKFNSLSL